MVGALVGLYLWCADSVGKGVGYWVGDLEGEAADGAVVLTLCKEGTPVGAPEFSPTPTTSDGATVGVRLDLEWVGDTVGATEGSGDT